MLIHDFEGNVHFSDGGSVVFHVTSDTPIVRVSGCVMFGGSITVAINVPHSPNITLMTFNCSTGSFHLVDIDGQFCSPRLVYLKNSLVLDLNNGNECQKGDSIPFLWVLWIFIGLIIISVVVAIFFIVKSRKRKRLEAKIEHFPPKE